MTTTDNAIVLYQGADGAASLEVHLDHETVWLTQKQMAELFQRERSVITKHLHNVFTEGELDEKSNVQNMHFAFSDKPVALRGCRRGCRVRPERLKDVDLKRSKGQETKRKTMKSNISQMAVMTLEEGEEILAGRATVQIPQVGIYKLLAKKKADGTIEWAHFVERDNGLKEKVMRGTVNSLDEFKIVIETVNNNLRRIFGVTMQPAEFEVRTLDGKKVSDTIH